MEHVSFFVITILVFVIAIFVTAITVVLYKVIFIMIFLLRIKSIQEETKFSFLFHSIVRTWIPLSLMNQTGNLLFSSLNLMKKNDLTVKGGTYWGHVFLKQKLSTFVR